MNEADHLYMRVLKYCYEREMFTKREAKEHFGFDDSRFRRYIGGFCNITVGCPQGEHEPDSTWEITSEAYLNYLDYLELHEARVSSRNAKWLAIVAIGLSVLATSSSIYFSLRQMDAFQSVRVENFATMDSLLTHSTTYRNPFSTTSIDSSYSIGSETMRFSWPRVTPSEAASRARRTE